ncbi:MAG: cyclic nucleotide-binding domain-containing protein, partial [Desulfobia sp.]
QVLDDVSLKEIINYLKIEKYENDGIIIRLGQPGKNLYMIVTGRVKVINAQEDIIAHLGRGEIFGEMSLFTGKPACATVKAVDEVKLLCINGKNLSQLFIKRPFLQMAFSRILAQRVSEANTSVARNLSYGMSGQLSELALPELLQMLNENMKTGLILLELPNSEKARIAFSEGEIVKVEYGDKTGKEAFYDLLKEKEGRFTFTANLSLEEMGAQPLGNFMKMLMDGMRYIDEEEAGEVQDYQ